VSGPAAVNFSNPNRAVTQATFGSSGSYVLRLSANDGQLTSTSDVTVVVNPPQNQAPVVNAGPSQTITLPANTATMNGTATDDGLPNGQLSIQWAVVSAPSGAAGLSFSNPVSPTTQVRFPIPGVYELRLSADDGQLAGFSDTVVVVNPAPINQPPVVNAGPNQIITLPVNTVTLNGSASDDGLPNGTLSFTWSVL